MIRCESVRFSYPNDPFGIAVADLTVEEGEQMAIVGPSGCGKTTLINLLAGILTPQQGSIVVDDIELTQFGERDRQDFRIVKMGLIFQEFELLEYLNVLDNILIPYRINPVLQLNDEVKARAEALCIQVGLKDKIRKLPKKLSQGERQRVAVCRALVTNPTLLLCDEPTANLDPENRDNILDILFQYCEASNKTLIVVTHDQEILHRFSRTLDIRNYRL